MFVLLILNSCIDPCKGVGCLNGGVCNEGECLCPEGFIGENCESTDPSFNKPIIECGANWTQDCFNSRWTFSIPDSSSIQILSDCYMGESCLLLLNPHDPNEVNPTPIILKTIISNIKKDSGYRVNCVAKFKGYPDVLSNPAFAYYAFSNDAWYGELYYWSEKKMYHEKDWTEHTYSFIGGEEKALEFELYSVYDSVWISRIEIEEF